MNNFFSRLTKNVIKEDKPEIHLKPAITSENLPEYFRIPEDLDYGFKFRIEKPPQFDAYGDHDGLPYDSERSGGKTMVKNGTIEEDDGDLAAIKMHAKESSKLSAKEISVGKSSEAQVDLSSSYISDILASLKQPLVQESRATRKNTEGEAIVKETSIISNDSVNTRVGSAMKDQISPHDTSEGLLQENLATAAARYTTEKDKHLHTTISNPQFLNVNNKKNSIGNTDHVVTINIGRIEVHGSSNKEKHIQRRSDSLKFPPLSLNEYLQKRSGAKP